MSEYNQLKYYKTSKNRLLEVDWSSVAYHQWHSMVSKKNAGRFEIITSEDEIRVWKNLMVGKMMRYIRLFNPKDIVFSLEGSGVIWRKTEYAKYYSTKTKIYYDSTGFYVKFDNFVYLVSKSTDGTFIKTKLDPMKPIPGKEIEYSKLSITAKEALRDVIPEYKGTRKKQPWKFITPKAEWVKIREEFVYDVAKIFRAKVVGHPLAEGDDILYVSTKFNETRYSDIVMVTGDSDFMQLLDQPNFVIFDHRKEQIVECVDPKKYLEVKILSGDDSDNINGIALPGKKVQLSVDKATVMVESIGSAYAQAKADGWDDQYLRNRKLIDMSSIPLDIHNEIRDTLSNATSDLAEWEAIYQIGLTDKLISEITAMREIGYYALCTNDEIDKNPNIFKEHLAPQERQVVMAEIEAPVYSYGVGSMFSSSF